MNYVIILLIVAAAALVLVSLVRGLLHFGQAGQALQDNSDTGSGPTASHQMQNRMMFARVKWQAITIILLVILGAIAAGQ